MHICTNLFIYVYYIGYVCMRVCVYMTKYVNAILFYVYLASFNFSLGLCVCHFLIHSLIPAKVYSICRQRCGDFEKLLANIKNGWAFKNVVNVKTYKNCKQYFAKLEKTMKQEKLMAVRK